MDIIEYADRDLAAMGLADRLAGTLRMLLSAQEAVSFVVPGGTTPGPVFDVLSAADLDWARVTVLLSDERWVSDTSPRSNAGLIRSRLLQGPAQKARFMPFYRDGMTAHAAAEVLSEELADILPPSVVLLGMGADMHTASLFPGADGLQAALAPDAAAVCAIETPAQPEARITLSARVLNDATEKHIVIFGDDKRAALTAALSRDPQDAPINAVCHGGFVHWAR